MGEMVKLNESCFLMGRFLKSTRSDRSENTHNKERQKEGREQRESKRDEDDVCDCCNDGACRHDDGQGGSTAVHEPG